MSKIISLLLVAASSAHAMMQGPHLLSVYEATPATCGAFANVQYTETCKTNPGTVGCIAITRPDEAAVMNGCQWCGLEMYPPCQEISSNSMNVDKPEWLTPSQANMQTCMKFSEPHKGIYITHDQMCLMTEHGGLGCISMSVETNPYTAAMVAFDHGNMGMKAMFNGCRYCGFGVYPACPPNTPMIGSATPMGTTVFGDARNTMNVAGGHQRFVERIQPHEATMQTCSKHNVPGNNVFYMFDPTCLMHGGVGCISMTSPQSMSKFNGCRYCSVTGGVYPACPAGALVRDSAPGAGRPLLREALLNVAERAMTPVEWIQPTEANMQTCSRHSVPENNVHITFDSTCLMHGGIGCISMTSSQFNGCRYCSVSGGVYPACPAGALMREALLRSAPGAGRPLLREALLGSVEPASGSWMEEAEVTPRFPRAREFLRDMAFTGENRVFKEALWGIRGVVDMVKEEAQDEKEVIEKVLTFIDTLKSGVRTSEQNWIAVLEQIQSVRSSHPTVALEDVKREIMWAKEKKMNQQIALEKFVSAIKELHQIKQSKIEKLQHLKIQMTELVDSKLDRLPKERVLDIATGLVSTLKSIRSEHNVEAQAKWEVVKSVFESEPVKVVNILRLAKMKLMTCMENEDCDVLVQNLAVLRDNAEIMADKVRKVVKHLVDVKIAESSADDKIKIQEMIFKAVRDWKTRWVNREL